MDGHPTATTFRLLDLPSEVVYAVGVAAEIKDAIALSATCRRLRAHLASLVWLRVKFSINSSRRPHYILTLNPYLKEHRETLNLIKEATITSHHLDVGPYLVQERSEDATFARTIRAMTSLRSLSLDVKGLCYLQIELLIFEFRTEPRFELQFLELRSKKACRALIECFGTNLRTLSLSEGPDSYGFKAASKSFKHLESLWIKTAEVFEEVKPFPLIDDRVLTQIAEAFPQLKSLALRETLPVDCYLFTPHRSTDKITTDSTKLGKVLREKLPNLQRFVCTMDLIDLGSLVHYLSRIRAFLNLAIRDHPALNEMMILLDCMHLVRWERDSNWISLERCPGPLLLGPASKVAQAMRETRLLKKIPLDSCGELRALE